MALTYAYIDYTSFLFVRDKYIVYAYLNTWTGVPSLYSE